ncbi:16S rRNA (cytidine(1402)-2'-O)-methyltransferase [Fretibacter rubidus]|uniref:16S rRNA (cytidine(1402)-2'-O)-methyltransferase n=1 Tax=Fretibacter rubidus TaxID=570162 RepID=UPI00352B99CA
MADTPNHPIVNSHPNQGGGRSQSLDAGANTQTLAPLTLASGLYIVATPIGNLRDITLRALDVLRGADLILAEDTRQTRKLLDAYDIKTPLSAYHDHNAAKRVPGVIKELLDGRVIAQVSDAGTPLVSDPGFKLARAAVEAGVDIYPLPGASAVLAGLVASALPSDCFTFAGFLPPKSSARQTALARFKTTPGTLIFFESGGRIKDCLSDALSVLGDRQGAVARELTKRYEETRRGSLSALIDSVTDDPPRGEIVLLIGPSDAGDIWDEAAVTAGLSDAIPQMGVKRASAHIAELSGWAKRDVYQLALSLK